MNRPPIEDLLKVLTASPFADTAAEYAAMIGVCEYALATEKKLDAARARLRELREVVYVSPELLGENKTDI